MSIKTAIAAISLMGSAISGCGNDPNVNSPGQTQHSIRKLQGGAFVVYYEWPYVEGRYGKERAIAVPGYMRDKGIVPPECNLGVQVLRGGEGEGGKGWAEFRCLKKQEQPMVKPEQL